MHLRDRKRSMRLKKLKIYFAIISLALLSACSTTQTEESKRAVAHKKIEHAFDVIGNTAGENEVNYERHAKGRFIAKKDKDNQPVINIDYKESGTASWYGGSDGFHGKKTANGTQFSSSDYTAAHRTLPLPSVVRVVNTSNQRSVLVVVTDRGPMHKGRIIDLSKKAAEDLDMLASGTAKVKVQYLHEETKKLIAKMPEPEREKAVIAFQSALTKHLADNDRVTTR
jgi:rare lipoprotein A